MNEKTYHRMTKKRSLRGFKLFKHKYLSKPRLYALLAKIRLVREVKIITPVLLNHSAINRVDLLNYKIKTDRGVFNLSYNAQGNAEIRKWWYESLFRRKRLYTIEDSTNYYLFVRVQSECEEFLVKLTPFCSGVVTRNRPIIQVFTPHRVPSVSLVETDMTADVKKIDCDFLNARMRVALDLIVQTEEEIEDGIKELINKATAQIHNYVDGNPEAINEKLTGVPFDGEFHTPEGNRLIPNNLCRKCGLPVFETTTEGYTAQCINCYEDLYSIEIDKVDPKYYEDVYEKCKLILYKLLTE